jgi:type II pantothenate kinase
MPLIAAIDFGLTNIDTAVRLPDGSVETRMIPACGAEIHAELTSVMGVMGHSLADFTRIAVTGGKAHQLAGQLENTNVVYVKEVNAIGRGGLALAGLKQGLVVSAGSGTAIVAGRNGEFSHVTGSAVGGGTLQGLGRLLVGTADALEIDRLAQQGDANGVDLTLVEAIGNRVGRLPLDANAVNFGRVARNPGPYRAEDLAAGLVRMVAQVITVIAVNASKVQGLEAVVFIGHLVDLASINRELNTTAGYYATALIIPPKPGSGTALGALLWLEEEEGIQYSERSLYAKPDHNTW